MTTLSTTTTMHNLTTITTNKPTVAFTTPPNYATRLSHLLTLKSFTPLWCPTITTEPTQQTLSSLAFHLSPHSLSLLSAIAFPSRTAITAFSTAALSLTTPLLPPREDTFIIAALGKDVELIDSTFLLNFCGDDISRVNVLVPTIATPSGLVQLLGTGRGRKVLCPVPRVVGLEEPPVVPDFLRELEAAGWVPIRVDAYETRWLGPACGKGVVELSEGGLLDAMVFTSSGEVEGLLKSLREFGWDWEMVRRRWPHLVVAAHGPVTAAGAERLGVTVDVVSGRFDSFQGVVDAVEAKLRGLDSSCM
ncbi:hypothetical protein POTOM_057515 [Populus tomentosa]|uniref:Tetrapyrrole biosynthesis uroporphyrinogen III synthase domain-containing protein n=1 Tax=Populus tomentosa TaxID=118781 RepID=A0A8X8C3H9_POPTO|nr:hypothetical protein POTOM_057515 [Populus tomentosa]